MQQYEEGTIADGPNGPIVFRGGQWVPLASAAQPAPMVIGTPDPATAYAGPKAAADLARTQQQTAVDAARLPGQMASDAAQLEAARLSAEKTRQELAGRPTAEQRGKAASEMPRLNLFQNNLNDLRALYAAGPGATKGLAGVKDYLPSEANDRFDKAGNALRGFVGNALGFTASQLNTPGETEAALGPYLPKARYRDSVNEDTFNRLQGLIDAAQTANGAVLGTTQAATGATRTEAQPQIDAVVNAMIRSGATDEQINAALTSLGGGKVNPAETEAARKYLKVNPGYKGGFSQATREVPTTFQERAAGSPVGAFFGAAINDGLAGIPAATFGNAAALEAQRQANPNASLAGTLVGGVAGAAGLQGGLTRAGAALGAGAVSRLLANPITADALYGGVSGANASGDVTGGLIGASVGAAGGMFGRGAARTAGAAFRGVRDPAVRYLADRGVPLTIGQAVGNSGRIGGALRGLEDRVSGLPVLGNIVGARRREGFEAFSRVGNTQAVAPLATQSNPLNVTIGETGELGVEALRRANTAGYTNAVGGRFASPDPTYDAAFQGARTQAGAIPNSGPQVQSELDAIVPGYFAAGQISGDNARAAVSELRALRRARANDPLGNRTGTAIRGAEDAVINLFERQSPGFAGDLAAANRVNGNVKTIETAVRNAGRNDGLYSPAQLDRAAQQSAARYGNNAATTQRPFFELTRAGQAVLPNTVPDSGTAGRMATLALPAALTGAGAGAGYAGGDTSTGTYAGLGLGALLAGGGSRGAQALAVRALLNRPDRLVRIGDGLYNRALLGGMFGAGLSAGSATLALQP